MFRAALPAPTIPILNMRPCGIVAEIPYAFRNLVKSPRSRIPLARVHARAHLPQRKALLPAGLDRQSLEAGGHHRRAEAESARCRVVESVSARPGIWAWPDQLRVRPVVRDHGPLRH